MARKRAVLLTILLLGGAAFLSPRPLLAQTATSGVVTGVVSDPSGAAVPGATVTLVQTSTGTTFTATTDSTGRYTFGSVPPATYTLRATKAGFQTGAVSELGVDILKSYTVNVTLQVGQVTQTVTVTATAGVELQTTNATVGNVLQTSALANLPEFGRNATALMFLQPGMTPNDPVGGTGTGGQIAGARSDQIFYTIDGGDGTSDLEGTNGYANASPGSASFGPTSSTAVVGTPISMTQEFRVTTAGANATFARAAGGEVALQTTRGSNSYHGSAYEYHDNDGLNANRWESNATRVAKPHSVDNRFGLTLGGPLLGPMSKNRAWFFAGWEEHRFNDASTLSRLVPTDTLRQGIIRFPDANGNVVSYSLAPGNLSANCGAAGNSACDPRNIGMSPVVKSQLALYPRGNFAALGDGLNTTGFLFNLPTPVKEDIGVVRLDFNLSSKWGFFTTYHVNKIARVSTSQVNIVSNPPSAAATSPVYPSMITFQTTGQLTPSLTTVIHGSYTRNGWDWGRTAPAPFVPGTTQALQLSGEGVGSNNGTGKLLADPININTQQARARIWDGHDWYFADDTSSVVGSHLFQFGAAGYIFYDFHERTDDVLGGLSSGPILFLEAKGNGNGTFFNDSSVLPPLTGSNLTRFEELYPAVLGVVDRGTQILARNGTFQPYPLGTPPFEHATLPAYYTYFQDTWQMSHSLTATYGLAWGVQLPVSEKEGKIVVPVYAATGQPVGYQSYLDARKASLEQTGVSVVNGQLNVLNPQLGLSPAAFLPHGSGIRGAQGVIGWHDFSPRVSLAWNLPYRNWLFGHEHNTVIRGGYAIMYDRITAVTPVLGNLLAGGLADVDTCGGPITNDTCSGHATTPATAFRIGVDGSSVPIPAPTAEPIPFIPTGTQAAPFGEFLIGPNDPNRTPGWNHNVTLSVQRALPRNMLLEIGYIGRFSRNIDQYYALNAPDYRTKDAVSGQTFAQAFDGVAQALRNKTPVPDEPFFDNLIGLANCTPKFQNCAQLVAAADRADLINGNLNNFGTFTFDFLTPGSLDNLQSTFVDGPGEGGYSNYSAGYISLRKGGGGTGLWSGLQFQINWTWSHAQGNQGANQESLNSPNSPYHLGLDYSSEVFDRRHVITAWWTHTLPFGKGTAFSFNSAALNRILGGWYWSGIWTFQTGLPLCIVADGNYGSGFSRGTCALPMNGLSLGSVSGTDHGNVLGSNHIGTSTLGLNLFSNPAAVFNNVRRPLLSQDGQIPFDSLRNPVAWDMDFSIGKNVAATERFKVIFSADLLNAFNHPNFEAPSLDLNAPTSFGTFSSQANNPRQVQVGLRVEF